MLRNIRSNRIDALLCLIQDIRSREFLFEVNGLLFCQVLTHTIKETVDRSFRDELRYNSSLV